MTKEQRTKRFRPYFQKVLNQHFPAESVVLLLRTDEYFERIGEDTRFAAASPNPVDRRLDFAAYFLAFIRTLEEKGTSYDDIRRLCLDVTIDFVSPKSRLESLLRKAPVWFVSSGIAKPLIRLFHEKISRLGHPDGFRASIITDKKLTYGLGYGIDIQECGICKLYRKHGAYRYASILCEADKVTSALAGLELVRSGTIANGSAICDFRFRRRK